MAYSKYRRLAAARVDILGGVIVGMALGWIGGTMLVPERECCDCDVIVIVRFLEQTVLMLYSS